MGNEVHLLEAGPPAGRAILLLHGMKFQAQTWRDLGTIAFLAGKGYRCLALDLPGFGQSPACEVEPSEVLAECVGGLGLGRPVVVGPSMGGRVALDFALSHPELVGGLVLIGAVGVEERRARLASIDVPCLAVWGSEDAIAPLDHAEILVSAMPRCRKAILQGASHPCYLDQPDLWHRTVEDFLAEFF
ncbi:MAG: alpha/beta fold hydrolase [Thermodesulfobacteriota bacterium]